MQAARSVTRERLAMGARPQGSPESSPAVSSLEYGGDFQAPGVSWDRGTPPSLPEELSPATRRNLLPTSP